MAIVILPAYKPDETFETLAAELWANGCRVVVVNDGSGGEYRSLFERLSDFCTVLHHGKNRGKGAAIKTGLSFVANNKVSCDEKTFGGCDWCEEEGCRRKLARGWCAEEACRRSLSHIGEQCTFCSERTQWQGRDCIGIMDADGQHTTEDMLRLLDCAASNRGALALGVRAVGAEMPLRSRLGNRVTRFVFSAISGVRVSDTQTGLRAFGTELIDDMLAVTGERYEYEMNVLMHCAKGRIPIREIPIQTIYHDRENSCSHFRALRDSVRIYRELLKFALSSFSSFLLDYGLFSLLMLVLPHTWVPVLLANVSARLVSGFYNYSMNCRFVFHERHRAETALDYLALASLILFLNNVILEIFVQGFHAGVYPAKLMTEMILFLVSWLVQRRLIFRKNRAPRCKVQKAVRI